MPVGLDIRINSRPDEPEPAKSPNPPSQKKLTEGHSPNLLPAAGGAGVHGTRPVLSPPPAKPSFSATGPFKSRRFKVGLALALLLAGGYGIFSESHFVATHNAVVSAYVVSLRTPIDGTIAGLPAAAGMRVEEGSIFGRVENPRVDKEHLENLRVIEERARSEADAIVAERDSLEAQRRELLARSEAYAAAVVSRLKLQITEASRLLDAKQIAVRQATADLDRGRKLSAAGIISTADFDKLQAQYDIAVQEEKAQEANLAAVRTSAAAAEKGIHSEAGVTNDVAYSRQRSDEITLRLAEINRDLTALEAQAVAAAKDLQQEQERTELMRQADLVAPVSGMLWKLEAMNGERVGTGDTVAEFVDCRQGFVLAEIPQERVPDIAPGGEARIKLSGDSKDRLGTVLAVGGDPRKEDTRKFAAFPLQDSSLQMATVRIGLTATPPGECVIGRTGRVLLPTNHSSVVGRWLRRYF